jgi:cytochrome c553
MGRLQRALARREDIVARLREPDRVRHVLGTNPAADQGGRRIGRTARSRNNLKRLDHPSRALLYRARWSGYVVLLVALMNFPVVVALAQPTEHAPDTMGARLRACEPCHGRQGEGTNNDYFPRLAGKPAGYLMNQLVAFRDGRRRYPPMNYLLEYQSDSYLQKIAEYFAALRPSPVQRAATAFTRT